MLKQSVKVEMSNPDYGGTPVKNFKTSDGKIYAVPLGLVCEAGDTIQVVDDAQQPVIQEFETGAKRGTDHADCDMSLIPPEAIRAWGRAFAEGKARYGRDNWLKGFPQCSVINHALQHIFSYLEGDRTEDHLGHALWNIGTAIHQEATRPDLLDLPAYQTSMSNTSKTL